MNEVNDDSLYVPTPERSLKKLNPIVIPEKIFVVSLKQLNVFVETINSVRCCVTPGCNGILVPVSLQSKGLGGTVNISYVCNGCGISKVCFEGSVKNESLNTTEVGASIQVAFIISGCLYATYCKVLKLSLGLDTVDFRAFYSTIERMYPVVKQMVDEMCEKAKEEMKTMDEHTLGSWKQAVTSADAAWMTRGYHSKNGTFSVRNYYNGALLYYKHLCQRGRDNIVEGELYKGTSKSMEGFAAQEVMHQAREEGMKLAVHWQDSDSSSANAVAQCFPECKIMICGGHAGKNHLKALENYSKMKEPKKDFITKHKDRFPLISSGVRCRCPKRHRQGCGCITDAFIMRARNNFSYILTDSKSAEEFAKRLRVLPRHVRDEHKWEVKKEGAEPTTEHCDFHPLKVCSCGKCADKEDFKCNGKDYATRYVLTCPFHSLLYEIECNYRASIADSLVHPVLKRGHSNWLEASHNVFIRFRSKDISLERLHYEVSTNLALLQSNLTYMYEKRGPKYHWIPDLYKRLNLPVYEGIQEAVTTSNIKRRQQLGRAKQEKVKKRRIELLKFRTKEAAERREWSKKHGGHTYGKTDDRDSKASEKKGSKAPEKKKGSKAPEKKKGSKAPEKKKGSKAPEKKKGNVLNIDNSEDMVCDEGDVVYTAKDQDTDDADTRTMLSDDELSFSDSSLEEDYLEDSMIYDDDEEPECTCGAEGRGHKRDCPLNPHCLYQAKPATSTPVRPPTSAPRKRSSLQVHVFPPAKKSKLSASCSTVQSARVLAESFSPDSSLSPEEDVYCNCGGRDVGDMVECDGRSCTFQWFHFDCVGITEAPEGKWYCDDCSQELNMDDSCVEVIGESPATVTVTGPLPTEEWKSAARDVIAKLSRCELTARSQRVQKIPCRDIEPHIRDRVQGDDNCLFRAFSKEVTGTECNHRAVRQAILNFMTHKDNAYSFCNDCFAGDTLAANLYEPIESMTNYIKENDLDGRGWGTDREIRAFATLCQIDVCTYSDNGSSRAWLKFSPLFCNEHCMPKSDYKIYLFHTEERNHYDRVVPSV